MGDIHKGMWASGRNLAAVHMGALGDFLLQWPALLSLSRHFNGAKNLYWAGRPTYSTWATGAGWQPAPPTVRQGVEALYASTSWPSSLAESRIVWIGLDKRPMEIRDARLWFIHGIKIGQPYKSPRKVVQLALERQGVPWATDWGDVFRATYGGWQDSEAAYAYDLLLFPGAGHLAKQWGEGKFFELAMRFQKTGKRVAFVLGPAEIERGVNPLVSSAADVLEMPPILRPSSLFELSSLLLQTRTILGNDSGPMHLASMHGTPGVVLFGPASRRQWAPEGLVALAGKAPCRPCTTTTATLGCAQPSCMSELSVDLVWEALAPFVG